MRRSSAILLVASAAALAIAALPRRASAWCRTTTTQGFEPTPDEPCDATGKPLYWASRCVGFSVQRDASAAARIDLATARDITQQAFDAWSKVECPADPVSCTGPFDRGHPAIVVQDSGPVACNCVEYNGKTGNANVIVFRDAGWAECDGTAKPDADTTLALTTVTYNTETGEIYDADMEVNTAENAITIADTGRVVYDFQSIMTHEAGHFLGLAHTQPVHDAATMFARYDKGQTFMRDPSTDDVCGICAAYPPTRASICDATPRRGLALECGGGDPATDTKASCGCTVPGEGGRGAHVVAGAAAVALSLGLARRGRVRARR